MAHALPDYPGALPLTLNSAYAIQDAAIAEFAEHIVGWKVGRIHPPTSDRLGTNRLAGPIFAPSLQNAVSDQAATGSIFRGGFGAAEAEFLFRIGTVPSPDQMSFTLDEAARLVDAVFVGIEIASSPFPGINALGPLVTISDFGNNNGLILGPEIENWRRSGLDAWSVTLQADGQVLGEGQASAFPDGPLGSVRFLLENLAERRVTIPPGTWISTGAVTGVHEVSEGQKIEARFGNNMMVSCQIIYA